MSPATSSHALATAGAPSRAPAVSIHLDLHRRSARKHARGEKGQQHMATKHSGIDVGIVAVPRDSKTELMRFRGIASPRRREGTP